MTKGRVVRLRRENAQLRGQIELLRALADCDPAERLTPEEQIQAEAIDLVSQLTTVQWMSHQMFREVSRAVLTESGDALKVLDSDGSLDDFREREW